MSLPGTLITRQLHRTLPSTLGRITQLPTALRISSPLIINNITPSISLRRNKQVQGYNLATCPRRRMSTETAAAPAAEQREKYEWLVILPDQEDALERRLAVRNVHLAGAKKLHESGFFTFGGGYLDDPLIEGSSAKPTFRGSAMLCLGETKEEVLEVLRKDPYTVNNVWDWEKVQIFAFKAAIRTPFGYKA
ncbi:hypothetical protein DFH27DRAFT_535270 [Peziza echinospora]|nr:hypothetical protein DFH27DRAFT_535270 [Peziza echinospora]